MTLSTVTVQPSHHAAAQPVEAVATETVTPPTNTTVTRTPEIKQAATKPVDIRIVVAKHALFYDAKVIHWQNIEELIAALPNPKLARVHLSRTTGAPDYAQGAVREKIRELEKRYGCKWGSTSGKGGRIAARYDAIRSRFDIVPNELKPDESETWRIEGVVQNSDGMPVADAEVVICPAADESVSEKMLNIHLENGRLHDPTDEIVTRSDASGRFVAYQSPGTPYYFLALHPAGFGLVQSDEFAKSHRIEIKPWARVHGRIKVDPRFEQSVEVKLRVPATDGWPELAFSQFSLNHDQQTDDGHFKFEFVPPGKDVALTRIVGNRPHPYATFQLQPGENKAIEIEPLSKEDGERFEKLKEQGKFNLFGE